MESPTAYFDPRMEQYIASFRAKHKEWLGLAQLLNVASHGVLEKGDDAARLADMKRGNAAIQRTADTGIHVSESRAPALAQRE